MLNQAQIDQFHTQGFLAVEQVLADEDLRPLEDEYQKLLDRKCCGLFEQGLIGDRFDGLEFGERFARLMSAYPDCVDDFNISLPLVNGEINADSYHSHNGPAVFGLLSNPKILDCVESLIGSEIASSPVLQMRIKPPQARLDANCVAHSNLGLTTWHQDTVSVLPEAESTEQITVWVAVTDADTENGCLVSIAESHLEGSLPHEAGEIAREPSVPPPLIRGRKGTLLPLKRGGIILFHRYNIHGSMPNRSNRLRWSVDIRYHPVGQPSGRPAFPGFIARSRRQPELELHDASAWRQLWIDARERIVRGTYKGLIFRDWL